MLQIVGIIVVLALVATLVVMRKRDSAGAKTTKSTSRI
jgi:hypothetical protein